MRDAWARAVLVTIGLCLVAGCGRGITVMSYNVCGLFDTVEQGTEFDDVKGGAYTEDDFRRKCGTVAGAIRRSTPRGPDIVALQEIENEGVLRSLRDGWLRGLGYRWYAAAGGPASATRVGVLSRIPITAVRSHLPSPGTPGTMQRAVLEVECSVRGVTLHLFNNHWKSKIGGVARTEAARVEAARVVASRVRRILAADPEADILVVGDLNEDHDEQAPSGVTVTALGAGGSGVIVLSDDPARLGERGSALCLYEPWLEGKVHAGSYAYAGSWSSPDHVLLASGLFDDKGLGYRPGGFRVVAIPFLVDEQSGFPRGAGGRGDEAYSDHLPLLVELDLLGGPRSPPPALR